MMNLQHQQLINTALQMGIEVQDVSAYFDKPVHILQKGDRKELLVDGTPTSLINLRADVFCNNKQLAKEAFKACGIPSPQSIIFTSLSEQKLHDCFATNKVYVAKPLDMTQGQGVVMHINNVAALEQYWQKYAGLTTHFMLEEQVTGDDLRIQVIAGKIIAACVREPAFVMGNDSSSLADLIAVRQAVMQMQNPLNYLEIDEISQQLLVEQGISLQDVPKNGTKIRLKTIANMSQGAIATDVTQQIHPDYHQLIAKLSAYLQTGYFGIDFITTDNSQNPLEYTTALEINSRPEWLHHTFSEVQQHDITRILLKHLFES